jgi:hypothetical protein
VPVPAHLGVSGPHPDRFSEIYGRGYRERGISLPEEQVIIFENAGVVGPITLNAICPQSFTLSTLSTSGIGIASIDGMVLTVNGRPIVGYPIIDPTIYAATSINARVAPVEIPAGSPVLLNATMVAPGGRWKLSLKGQVIFAPNKTATLP